MTTIALLAMYMIIWLVVFFSLLPFDVNRNRKFLVPANEVGAPENPKMLKKIIYCTGITTFVFIILFFLIKYEYLNLKPLMSHNEGVTILKKKLCGPLARMGSI